MYVVEVDVSKREARQLLDITGRLRQLHWNTELASQ
jgi:hypothetical protein